MISEVIYSVEVEIIRYPGDAEDGMPRETPTIVRYCDLCRRWGSTGSTHMCWRNWQPRLSDLLIEMSRSGRQS